MNMRSGSCAGEKVKTCYGGLRKDGMGIARTCSSVLQFTHVANSEEALLAYEQDHSGD